MNKIILPTEIFGVNTKEAYERVLAGADKNQSVAKPKINPDVQHLNGFIYVPSIELYVAKERTLLGKDWFECHKELQSDRKRMPTIPEFIEFLKYLRLNPSDENIKIYKDITEVREPLRAEWIDADFKVKGRDLYINSNHVLDADGNLIPQNSEILDKGTLMKDKTPGISLDDYLDLNHTKQGLPNKKVKSGDLYYWYPRSDNNSVSRFYAYSVRAGLNCSGDPSGRGPALGVRGCITQEN